MLFMKSQMLPTATYSQQSIQRLLLLICALLISTSTWSQQLRNHEGASVDDIAGIVPQQVDLKRYGSYGQSYKL